MKAQVTDNFDLVLRWDDSRSEISWSGCSNCEFEVRAKLWIPGGVNYQGSTKIEFSTTCYAYALRLFAESLERLAGGQQDRASYRGSEDMEIKILERQGQAGCSDRRIMACDLKFDLLRAVDMVWCDNQIEATLGVCEDAEGVAKAIREVISTLGLDDSRKGGL